MEITEPKIADPPPAELTDVWRSTTPFYTLHRYPLEMQLHCQQSDLDSILR